MTVVRFRAKPMLVRAVQIGERAWDDMQGEADRLRRVLDIDDRDYVWGGDLHGHIMIAHHDEDAKPTQWIVRLPDHFDVPAGRELPTLLVLSDETFRMLFAPAQDVELPDDGEPD
jgi:hypothetical protein